jgi:hypothetical protein
VRYGALGLKMLEVHSIDAEITRAALATKEAS